MYISRNENNNTSYKKKRGQIDFIPAKEPIFQSEEHQEHEELEAPHDMLLSEYSGEVYFHWRAPEFEIIERDKKWYFYVVLVLLIIISYAIYMNSLVMAITFILIGAVGYIHINKTPRMLEFAVTSEGVIAGREIYEYENLKSFWIFYEPEGEKIISLHTKSYLAPYVHIPIHSEDPVQIREVLLEHIPEEKQEPGLIETVDRILRL